MYVTVWFIVFVNTSLYNRNCVGYCVCECVVVCTQVCVGDCGFMCRTVYSLLCICEYTVAYT